MTRRGESVSGHKYLYRIGSPGAYRYIYKMADGSHKNIGPEDPTQHKLAQREHIQRLLMGRNDPEHGRTGHHDLSNEDIAHMTGVAVGSVRASHANLPRPGRTPDFDAHQLKEANHKDPGSDDYHAHHASVHGIEHANTVRAHQATHRAMSAGVESTRSAPPTAAHPAGRAAGESNGAYNTRLSAMGMSELQREVERYRSVGFSVEINHDDLDETRRDLLRVSRPRTTARTTRTSTEEAASAHRAAHARRVSEPGISDAEMPIGWHRVPGVQHSVEVTERGHIYRVVKDDGGKYRVWVKPEGGDVFTRLGDGFNTMNDATMHVRFPDDAHRAHLRSIAPATERVAPAARQPDDRPIGSRTEREVDRAPAAPTETKAQEEARLLAALKTKHGVALASTHTPAPEETPAAVQAATARASSVSPRETTATPLTDAARADAAAGTPLSQVASRDRSRRAEQAARRAEGRPEDAPFGSLAESHGTPAETPAAVSAAVERATSVSSPAATELAAHDRDFGRSEGAVRATVEAHARGENPYLTRAKEVFERVKSSLTEERKTVVGHLLTAINQAHQEHEVHGTAMTQELVNAYYKTLVPRSRGVSEAAMSHLERATGHLFNELITNPPVNPEVERMRRGFAAKQMARLEPFVHDRFKEKRTAYETAHPGKTIYPTYDDLMSWSEWSTKTGQPVPDHATAGGRTQKAHPKEFYDTIHKENGKNVMPPGWLPLHLAPVWNYMAKNLAGKTMTDSSGRSAPAVYAGTRLTSDEAARRGVSPEGKVSLPQQWQEGESIFESALRKYVQFRGGPDQLIDIPASKLAEVGMTHADLFRSLFAGSMDAAQLRRLIASKIIDPVALLPFVKKAAGLNKSFTLVVEPDEDYDFGTTMLKSMFKRTDLKKSRIEKIRSVLRERTAR